MRLKRGALYALGASALTATAGCSSPNLQPPYGRPPPFDASFVEDASREDAADGGTTPQDAAAHTVGGDAGGDEGPIEGGEPVDGNADAEAD
jgi:hypothetical protein